ncbi:MAG: hypothetical protein KAU38_08565 [Desulfobacterales bacterium]|nr:hypothetical protein [Desulfobacterales bacterium]
MLGIVNVTYTHNPCPMEAPEEEDHVALTEEDIGEIFLLLKTVVDLLDMTA